MAPRRLFLSCSLLGALANAAITVAGGHLSVLLALRFATGFFLAGIYPVGMKIAASWYQRGLGNALGLLVGALVLGTAFPHLLGAGGGQWPWRTVLLSVSTLAAAGGIALYLLVPTGPYLSARTSFDPRALGRIFRKPDFRAAAFGYFGHMWELYAFWAFLPVLLTAHVGRHCGVELDISLWSFLIIGVGAVGCSVGGWISARRGSAPVATVQIATSGLLCFFSPLLFLLPTPLFLLVLLGWGTVVVGDSPQFSALNASTAPRHLVGTALTIATCVGFLLTIPSIQLLGWLTAQVGPQFSFLALAPGPALGLVALYRLRIHVQS